MKKACLLWKTSELNPREVRELPPQFKQWLETNDDRITAVRKDKETAENGRLFISGRDRGRAI